MNSGRTRGAALLAAACIATPAHAQVARDGATVDFGISGVQYAGFLPSAAFAVTPALFVDGADAALSLRGTLLVFQSGNSSLQGAIAASAVRRITASWRAEVWGTSGGSKYADVAIRWHGIGGVRALRTIGRTTLWADASGGATSYGGPLRPMMALGAGAWTQRAGVAVGFSGSRTRLGDTVYTDLRAEGRQSLVGVVLRGELGARVWSRGGGRGVYGEGSATTRLGEQLALVIAAGVYPSDPPRGSISGGYVSAALRIGAWAPRPIAPAQPAPNHTGTGSATGPRPSGESGPWLEVRAEPAGTVRLLVHAGDALSVEVAGDFTDWLPVSLVAVGGGVWETRLVIAPGLHRANVRLGDGPWVVPLGTRRAADDYGAEIGIFVVP